VLAKAFASLDLLSGGRVELGIGAGGYWDKIQSFGAERLSAGASLDALEEAIAVIRAVWSGERGVSLGGRFHRLEAASTGPRPAHPIGIWVGAVGPRAFRLTGRLADGWAAPSGPPPAPTRSGPVPSSGRRSSPTCTARSASTASCSGPSAPPSSRSSGSPTRSSPNPRAGRASRPPGMTPPLTASRMLLASYLYGTV
jgi:hypothetical protein